MEKKCTRINAHKKDIPPRRVECLCEFILQTSQKVVDMPIMKG